MNKAWVAGLLAVLAGQGWAEEQVLSTVTVTADADALEERRQAVTQKVILNQAEIANLGATTVSEVISKLPGIDAGSQDAHGGQSAGVIVVPVTEHDGIKVFQRTAESPGVFEHQFRLARVEQHAPPAAFDEERQTVLRFQPAPVNRVLHEHGDAKFFTHEV